MEISQNFVAFSEYMNFNDMIIHLLSSMGGSEKERLVLLIKDIKAEFCITFAWVVFQYFSAEVSLKISWLEQKIMQNTKDCFNYECTLFSAELL